MKKEDLSIEMRDTLEAILHELTGYSVSEAKQLLKLAAQEAEERAVIEQPMEVGK